MYTRLFGILTEWLKHNERISVKKDSWFHHSNITLAESLKLVYYWSVGLTVAQIHRETSLSKPTIVDITRFLRELCAIVMIENGTPLGGLDENGSPRIVEIDESKFGRMKYHRVRGKQWLRVVYDKNNEDDEVASCA